MWSAPVDRARSLGSSSAGYMIGVLLGYPVCGTIAYYMDWKGVFYVTGRYLIALLRVKVSI